MIENLKAAPPIEVKTINLKVSWIWRLYSFYLNNLTKRNQVRVAAFNRGGQMFIGFFQVVSETEYHCLAQSCIGAPAMVDIISNCQNALDTHRAFFKQGASLEQTQAIEASKT